MSDKRILQAGAIPYRTRKKRGKQVLLITTRAGIWSVPKGMIDPGNSPEETALIETREEAGALGAISGDALGHFDYEKWDRRFRVVLFPLRVDRLLDRWPEQELRERSWFDLDQAAQTVGRPGIPPLIESLARWLRNNR